MILIAAILLLLYKKLNNFKGYKHVRQAFVEEIKIELMRPIIIWTGGDPSKLDEYLEMRRAAILGVV